MLPFTSDQNTYIAKFDYKIDEMGKHNGSSAAIYRMIARTAFPNSPRTARQQRLPRNSKGIAAGYTGVLSANIVNTFRYGLTRAGNENTGVLASNYAWFRGYNTPTASPPEPLVSFRPHHR